jgi:hypothetical protein
VWKGNNLIELSLHHIQKVMNIGLDCNLQAMTHEGWMKCNHSANFLLPETKFLKEEHFRQQVGFHTVSSFDLVKAQI